MTEATTETPLTPPASRPMPPLSPQMFDLNGKGLKVPLAEVLSMADKDCRYCMGTGKQCYFDGPKRDHPIAERVCGCAVRLMRKKLAGETPSVPAARVEKNTDLERERVTKKIANLEAIVANLEAEVAQRIQGHDAGIDLAQLSLVSATNDMDAAEAGRLAKVDGLRHLEEHLAELQQAIAAQRAAIEDAAEAVIELGRKRQSRAIALSNLRAASQRILDQAAPTRHRIDRLKAKIAATKQQNAHLFASES
jgi:hypothetical protein